MVNYRKIVVWSAAGLLGGLLVLALALPLGFRHYLHSEAFRRRIGTVAGEALRAEAEFLPPHLTGTTAYTDGFRAHGLAGASFGELRADQIRADFNWHGLLQHKWQIDALAVERLEVQLAEPTEPLPAARAPEVKTPRVPRSGTPWQLDLRQAKVRDSHWRWGGGEVPTGELAQAPLTLTPKGDSWMIAIDGGHLRQTGWPEITVEAARLRLQGETLFITESRLLQGGGAARVTGELAFHRQLELQVALEGLEVTPLLDGDWRTRLSGKVYGEGTVQAPLGREESRGPTIQGSAHLVGGKLTALPILDQIATFTRTQRFRTLELSTAALEFTQEGDRFTGRHLIAEAEGLLRIEGDFTLVAGQIEGTFQVGVTAASLQWLPGSQARVFTVARGGYWWAPMRLTGAAEHPTEDLTPKLAQAATGEVLQSAGSAVEGASKAARETAKDLLDRLLR